MGCAGMRSPTVERPAVTMSGMALCSIALPSPPLFEDQRQRAGPESAGEAVGDFWPVRN